MKEYALRSKRLVDFGLIIEFALSRTSAEVLVLVLVAESEPFKYTIWLCLGSGLSSGWLEAGNRTKT